ncbi:transcriptional repressor TraM [Rhizobiaceae bacterium n13]|uniref:transcriptional repressor TraM n=1 Tax=Ferirhizobium litorale TaxID=2927786 RepID=UPI0024B31CC7|nr:transcriptional repressor TraM [Fererhizobium litorale]MDI7864962.1 transcriptional repressor TraM [Fererhizobium litorale]
MNDVEASEVEHADRRPQYTSMQKSELEALAISAIREHRRLLAADEAVYEEWIRASDDPKVPNSIRRTLQDEHITRQQKSKAQQMELSDMLDALGFVPAVPIGDD